MGNVLEFKKPVKAENLVDAPQGYVRACPRCRRRKYVTAHFSGDDVVLICGHCFITGRIPNGRNRMAKRR